MYILEYHDNDGDGHWRVETLAFYDNLDVMMENIMAVKDHFSVDDAIIFTGLTVPSTIIYHPFNGNYVNMCRDNYLFRVILDRDAEYVHKDYHHILRVREYVNGTYDPYLEEEISND
jgi:hypothetical protein